MAVTINIEAETVNVILKGNLNENGANELYNKVSSLKNNKNIKKININCRMVEKIDSPGIGRLIYLYKVFNSRNISITIQNLSPYYKEIFQSLKMDKLFTLE